MTKEQARKLHCTVEAALALVGGKYKAIIVWWLDHRTTMRFSELQRAIPQATAKMLIQQLREMEGDELVSRRVYPVVPPKTEYSLTDLGKSLVPIVKAMDRWGESWFRRMGLHVPCDDE